MDLKDPLLWHHAAALSYFMLHRGPSKRVSAGSMPSDGHVIQDGSEEDKCLQHIRMESWDPVYVIYAQNIYHLADSPRHQYICICLPYSWDMEGICCTVQGVVHHARGCVKWACSVLSYPWWWSWDPHNHSWYVWKASTWYVYHSLGIYIAYAEYII